MHGIDIKRGHSGDPSHLVSYDPESEAVDVGVAVGGGSVGGGVVGGVTGWDRATCWVLTSARARMCESRIRSSCNRSSIRSNLIFAAVYNAIGMALALQMEQRAAL